jgi:quercetin dioxygenase-like cupin family protein
MIDTTVTKIDSAHSPKGAMGQKYLASGKKIAMRIWENEPPSDDKPMSQREYETVGYVVSGRARLRAEDQTLELGPGDSWVVPAGTQHTYRILEPFTAVEATAPPAEEHGRDHL